MKENRQTAIYEFGSYALNVSTRTLTRGGGKTELRGKPFDVLVHLVMNAGMMLSKESIYDAVWGRHANRSDFDPNLIDQALTAIRRCLGPADSADLLKTERSRGVAFMGQVRTVSPTVAPGRAFRVVVAVASFAAIVVFITLLTLRDRRAQAYTGGSPRPVTSTGYPKFGPFVESDGRVYFTEARDDSFHIAWVDPTTGETGYLPTTLGSVAVAGISPDRSALLVRAPVVDYHSDARLYMMDIRSGKYSLVAQRGFDGGWSPDASTLYFSTNNQIRALNLSTGSEHIVIDQDNAGVPWWPRVARDGSRLRYSVFGSKSQFSTTWEFDLRQRRTKQLFSERPQALTAACGDWDETGTFYFQAGRANGPFTIWAARDEFEAVPFQLTPEGPFNFQFPTPGAHRGLLYVRGQHVKTEMVAFTRLGNISSTFQEALSPAFAVLSPTQSYSATYRSSPIEELLLVDLKTGATRTLVAPPKQSAVPAWSHDGKRLAIPTRVPGSPWTIQVVTVQTGDTKELQPCPTHCIDPSWTLDDGGIFFGEVPTAQTESPVHIYYADLTSGRILPLQGSEGLFRPVLSRDGLWIAAIDAADQEIKVRQMTGGDWLPVGETASYVQWTPESNGVVLLKPSRSLTRVLRIEIPAMRQTEVTELREFRHFGQWFGVTAQGTLLLPKDISTQEIYQIHVRP